MPDQQDKDVPGVAREGQLGGVPCRAEEFERWSRTLLQYERAHLSRVMATQRAYLSDTDVDAIMHDLKDIDQVLAHKGTAELKVASDETVKGLLGLDPVNDGPSVEMWPASEGPVRPSQRC
jgi:hypothetical protein